MHGVHDGLSFRSAIQQAHRSDSCPGGAEGSAQKEGQPFSQTSLRHISLCETVAVAGSSHVDLPTHRLAEAVAGYWFAAVVTEAAGTDGVAATTRAHWFSARSACAGGAHHGAEA